MPVNRLLSLCSKFTLHCLLCKNWFGPFKYFSFASWHDVKALSEENAGKTLEEKVVFLPNLECSSWQDLIPCSFSSVCIFSTISGSWNAWQSAALTSSPKHPVSVVAQGLWWDRFLVSSHSTAPEQLLHTEPQPRLPNQGQDLNPGGLFLSAASQSQARQTLLSFILPCFSELLFVTNVSFLARNLSAQIICDFSILIKPWLQIKFQATNP